jgi:very-short-patch-repair endonuclease
MMGEVTSIKAAKRWPIANGAESHIEALLARARLKLVDTGFRNRLIHTPRSAKRNRAVSVTGNASDQVFSDLVRDNKQLPFVAAGETVEAQHEAPAQRRPRLVSSAKSCRSGLRTSLPASLLHKRLYAMQRDAKTAEEERGINVLFLALGFLRWYEDEKSEIPRDAPLLLLPVSLVRDGKRSGFDLKLREDDITSNQALQERLRSDFGIALPDIPDSGGWLPSGYFQAVADAVAANRRWSIDANAIELGFYSYSKLLMVRDLEPANWPNGKLAAHPLLRGLLCDGFAAEPPVLPHDARLDEVLDPASLIHVVDADASQARVIETVRAGRNLIVQGPPGTGKSQTITNIIATAVHDGRTVLFAAEKMAALDVVHARLKAAGLGDICLDLHSQAASKRLVAEKLERTLQAASVLPGADDGNAAQLLAVRDKLNSAAKRLHAKIADTGMTPYKALAVQIAAAARGFAPDEGLVLEAGRWTGNEFEEKVRLISRLAHLIQSAGPLPAHTYFGVRRIDVQPADFLRQISKLQELADKAASLASYAATITSYFGIASSPSLSVVKGLIGIFQAVLQLPPGSESLASAIAACSSPDRIAEAAALGARWREQQAPYAQTFHPAAWTAPVAKLRAPLARGATFWLARAGKDYREAGRSLASLLSVPLPKLPAERLALADALLESQALRRKFAAEAGLLSSIMGDVLQGRKSTFRLIHRVARIVARLIAFDPRLNAERVIAIAHDGAARAHYENLEASLREVAVLLRDAVQSLGLDIAALFQTSSAAAIDLNALSERAAGWAANPACFEEWIRLAKADREVRASGAEKIADALAFGTLEPKNAYSAIDAAFAEASWKKAIAADPELAAFDGERHGEAIALFAALEEQSREAAAQRVRARHCNAIPRGAQGEMAVIRSEISRKRSHMPLRKLMMAAGSAIQKIKPVFLMSPVSAAQFLPPGLLDFDLLIIDEASQMRPEDALGLIARCRQIVVVGDKKQLPPTSFFDRLTADEPDPEENEDASIRDMAATAPVTDLESILTLCEARGLDSQMLRWHYRSRHPSLIEVSNAEFYHHLVMPPAPETARTSKGLILRRVQGAYERGGRRINLVEAETVADAVSSHARSCGSLSLGIVTFSTAQRDLIADILEARRRLDPALDAYLANGGHEDVFIKNLENVQGDERDVILISIGYGPRAAGQPLDSMAFGPISAEGGERRLNVLFTRARVRCEVFVSFAAADINLERARGEGPRVLKRFLQFAETGILQESRPSGAGFDSPFEAAVAEAIESFGYKADAQVGSAGFKIDLAVRDPARPGRYMLAVECDGATYHSALWARERDRLRQQVLEGLGWRFYRIWSTDWFYRRKEQLEKLKQVLDEVRAEEIANSPLPSPRSQKEASSSQPLQPQPIPQPYELARCDVTLSDRAGEIEREKLAAIVKSVIVQEGPIHRDEIARRVAGILGKSRPGRRVSKSVEGALIFLQNHAHDIQNDAEFWCTPGQKAAPIVRNRSAAPPSLRKLAMIAASEIRSAIAMARLQNGGLDPNQLPGAVAKLLGIQTTPAELRTLVLSQLP